MRIPCTPLRLCVGKFNFEKESRIPRPFLKKRFSHSAVFRSAGLVLIGLVFVSGCFGSSSEEIALEPVKGTLTVDGKKIGGVASIGVSFNSTGQGFGAYGITDSEGRYELTYRDGRKGIPVGTYKVTYSKIGMPDGSAIPKFIASPSEVGAVDVIPEQFRDVSKIDKTVTVPQGGTTIDLELHIK